MTVAIKTTTGAADSPGSVNRPWFRMSDTCIVNTAGVTDIARISDASEGIIFNQDSGLRFNYADASTANAKFEEIFTILEAFVNVTDLR